MIDYSTCKENLKKVEINRIAGVEQYIDTQLSTRGIVELDVWKYLELLQETVTFNTIGYLKYKNGFDELVIDLYCAGTRCISGILNERSSNLYVNPFKSLLNNYHKRGFKFGFRLTRGRICSIIIRVGEFV